MVEKWKCHESLWDGLGWMYKIGCKNPNESTEGWEMTSKRKWKEQQQNEEYRQMKTEQQNGRLLTNEDTTTKWRTSTNEDKTTKWRTKMKNNNITKTSREVLPNKVASLGVFVTSTPDHKRNRKTMVLGVWMPLTAANSQSKIQQ